MVAGRVPRVAKEVLGAAPVGARILLRERGTVDEKPIIEYIENQKWNEDQEGFKITVPREP